MLKVGCPRIKKISRVQSGTRILWPKNYQADTLVEGDFECDTRIDQLLDKINKDFDEDKDFTSEKQVENDIQFRFRKFIRND